MKKYDYEQLEKELRTKAKSLERNIRYDKPEEYSYKERHRTGLFYSQTFRTVVSAALALAFIIWFNIIVNRMKNYAPPSGSSYSVGSTDRIKDGASQDQIKKLEDASADKLPALLLTYSDGCSDFKEFSQTYGYYYGKIYKSGYAHDVASALMKAWSEQAGDPLKDEITAAALYRMIVISGEAELFGTGTEFYNCDSLAGYLKSAAENTGREYIEAQFKGLDYTYGVADRESAGVYADNYSVAVTEYNEPEGYAERIVTVDSFERFSGKYANAADALKLIREAQKTLKKD